MNKKLRVETTLIDEKKQQSLLISSGLKEENKMGKVMQYVME